MKNKYDNVIVRNIEVGDEEQVTEMLIDAFVPQYFDFKNYVSGIRYLDPTYHTKNVLLIEADGKIVAHIHILPRQIKVGKAVLNCGGIACVVTGRKYRGHGYSRILMQQCLKFMIQEGYDLSLLNGIGGFYHKFGFAKVMPSYLYTIDVGATTKLQSDQRIRDATESDCRVLDELYQQEYSEITGTVIRPASMWWPFLRQLHGDLLVVVNKRDIPEGYIWFEKSDDPVVFEVGAKNAKAAKNILKYLSDQKKALYKSDIITALHPSQRFVDFTAEEFGGKCEMEYRMSGGWMGRICNLSSLLEKLKPELNHRLKCSEFNSWSGNITLVTDIGAVEFEINNGVLSYTEEGDHSKNIVEISQNCLTQLIFGYHSIKELEFSKSWHVHEPIEKMLDILFPKGFPGISRIDWF